MIPMECGKSRQKTMVSKGVFGGEKPPTSFPWIQDSIILDKLKNHLPILKSPLKYPSYFPMALAQPLLFCAFLNEENHPHAVVMRSCGHAPCMGRRAQ